MDTTQRPKPVVLIVLDGWGIGPANAGNALTQANLPNFRKFSVAYPHTQLTASGEAVGLPRGEDGNTETGHLNLGAGKIVYQDLPRINMSVADGTFESNPVFSQAFEHVKRNNSSLHLMGLIGSGGVHSNINHLYALLSAAKKAGLTNNVILDLFTDGRDSPPTAAISYLNQITQHLQQLGIGQLGTIMGRYFAMDRDRRWDRTEIAYDALTVGSPCTNKDPAEIIQERYNSGETDEFIKPFNVCGKGDNQSHLIHDNDAVIFFNFRIDRPRQLTKALILPNFEEGISTEGFDPYAIKYERSHIKPKGPTKTFQRKHVLKNLFFVTMTEYERGLPVNIAFPPQAVDMPLGRVIAERGLRQLRMSETEKERFVTYYFNGQREDSFINEDRAIIPSKSVATYDLAPEMSAREITSTLIEKINEDIYDFILVNYANSDMVGHTGNLQATIKSVEILDECLGEVFKVIDSKGGIMVVTADHGNAEEMINNESGEVDTEHSTYPVPFLLLSKRYQNQSRMLPSGILADVGPTILKLMEIPKPNVMTGRSLI